MSSIFSPYSAGEAGAAAFFDAVVLAVDVELPLVAALVLAAPAEALGLEAEVFVAGFFSAVVDAAFARAGFLGSTAGLASVFLTAGFFFGAAAFAAAGFAALGLAAGFAALGLAAGFATLGLAGAFGALTGEAAGPPRKSMTPPTFGSVTFFGAAAFGAAAFGAAVLGAAAFGAAALAGRGVLAALFSGAC